MAKENKTELLQKQHYDAIAAKYAAHYGDTWSQKYRHQFINEPLFEGINLSGLLVVDALCGSGENTGYLLANGADVIGVDISQEEINQFQEQFPACKVKCTSVLDTGLESNTYDCVVVVGGLHHIHPNVVAGIIEIHRILKKGGFFCFVEPHKGSFPDRIRQLWYKSDHLFAENEDAIDLSELKIHFSSSFTFINEKYKGNIAYLFVLNSLIFRIPLWAKPMYSPILLKIESILEKMQGKLLSCFVICQWQKR